MTFLGPILLCALCVVPILLEESAETRSEIIVVDNTNLLSKYSLNDSDSTSTETESDAVPLFKGRFKSDDAIKFEYLDDIETRIKARKELDRILGLNEIVDVASLQMGDITINIVDASKRDALEDKSNHVELEDKDMVILDEGEDNGEKRQTEEDKN